MFTTRNATVNDAALITAHRHAMFASMPNPNRRALETMSGAFEPWIGEKLAKGRYIGWIAEESGRVAGSAGLLILDWPPHPLDPSGHERAYVLNVFVEPDFRKRGLAHELLEHCMAEARRRGIHVITLHASDAGRPVYEGYGFHATSEMLYTEPAKE
jgi:GNAT superfamily N-acetyltransferase